MKKLIYLFLGLLFVACSSDDSTSDDSNSIEGRWNFISQTDCGEIAFVSDSCDLESYMTLNDGFGEITFYDNADENENPIPCQIIAYIDVTYSTIPNSPNTYIFTVGEEQITAIVDGNTLTLTETYDAIDTLCPQQEGTIIEETIFSRN